MPETFLILLAGGAMLAAAASNPRDVTLHWLRLGGIVALSMAGLAAFFLFRRGAQPDLPLFYRRIQVGLFVGTIGAVLAQIAFVQVAWIRAQRGAAAAAYVLAVLAAANVLHGLMHAAGRAVPFPPKGLSIGIQTLGCAGVAAMTGLALMDMLLGHAYLTAAKMTIAPFRRLNLALALVIGLRVVMSTLGVWLLVRWRPVEMLWGVQGLYMLTRWLVGLAVPAIFVYMAHDCIRRRSTQSATGILYVAGVLVFIGEIVALNLLRETGLPF